MNPYSTDPDRKTTKAGELAALLMQRPDYNVLLCASSCIPPSPWTEDFVAAIDDKFRVIRLTGDFT